MVGSVSEQIKHSLSYAEKCLTDQEIEAFSALMRRFTGAILTTKDKRLVSSRLIRRLIHYRFQTFSEYINLLENEDESAERQVFIDALTTNESYFFREPGHFDFVRQVALPKLRRLGAVRAWSAASSRGQEAYSVAMLLQDQLGLIPWEVVGTDINKSVIREAKKGVYPMSRVHLMPPQFLKHYCLKGEGPMDGKMMVSPNLKNRVKFMLFNLMEKPSEIGKFNLIFLRNVLIYFDETNQRRLINNVLSCLTDDGYFFIGTSEHIQAERFDLKQIEKSVFIRSNA